MPQAVPLPRSGVSDALRARPIHCCDTKISEIRFFLESRCSTLVAAPLDLQRQQDLYLAHSTAWHDGSVDLDFVLYDDTVTSTDASTATAADKNPKVDYSALSALPPPARRAGESVEDRAEALQRWVERCFEASASTNLSARLSKVSTRLAFEYDSYLSTLALPDQSRCVRGLVIPGSSGGAGHATVALTIPLLLTQQSTILSTVQNTLLLYAKFTDVPFHKPQHLVSLSTDLCIRLSVQDGPQGDRLSVLSERLAVHVEDTTTSGQLSLQVLLQSLVDFRSLPQLSSTLQRGDGFMDYIAKLEGALLQHLRHPLHFLCLTLGLTATFGLPVELCPAATMDPSAESLSLLPLVRTAAFCVIDRRTQASFMIGLHYYSGRELPSVGVVASQYPSDSSRVAPLRAKVKYPDGTAENIARDKDGFLQVEELTKVVSAGVMEALSKLMGVFSS